MKRYRLYCLDGAKRFLRAELIEADDDLVAIELAGVVGGDSRHCEVWDHDRLVARITRPD